jgi:hypothetical protein
MSTSKPIALILGAGKRVGASSAQLLTSKGYRVAQAARSLQQNAGQDDNLFLTVDLSKPDTVSSVFARLREVWGEPSVVIYNGQSKPTIPYHFSTRTLLLTPSSNNSRRSRLHLPPPHPTLSGDLHRPPAHKPHLRLHRRRRSLHLFPIPALISIQNLPLHGKYLQRRNTLLQTFDLRRG